jgi:putative chitinase
MTFVNVLFNLWPNGDQKVPGLRDGIAATAQSVFAKYGISSPLLIAHVMAQISHECGAGHDVIENMNYTAIRMTQVWPTRFHSTAEAAPFAGNPRALANKVYNGRMGNRSGSDDGYNFRGRGGSQTTGREGYERVKKQTGLDVVANPDILIDPKHFLECAVSDFINCGCLPYAKADDMLNVTRRLNGGTVGLASRQAWLAKWKAALGTGPVVFAPAGTVATPKSIPLQPVNDTVIPRDPTGIEVVDPVSPVTPVKPATPTSVKAGGAAVIVAAPIAVASAGYGWLEIGLSAFIAVGLVAAVVLLIRKFR